MLEDRRQIQTAVLGSADSEEPLMLPLEAIELNAFRRLYEHATFWCGVLLGGCGGQLATKLYTDRVCHFAHHPDPDGLPHVCRRRARGVASADHLYVKSAAVTWLHERGEQARFDFAQSAGAPLGSVVDIRWRSRGLRVHLDRAVPPVWDEDSEPVLGMSVPVDRDTLIRRWYVHRIRLDSEGTTRRVRIGTEAFARPTEWFGLDECEMSERGLSTPAVEQIVRAHRTPPPAQWPAPKAKKAPDAQARAQTLLRRLADARKVDSVVMVDRVCGDIAALTGVSRETQEQLDVAVDEAHRWLESQVEVRRDLFTRLDEAVAGRRTEQVREFLTLANATADHDRTEDEDRIARAAAGYLDAQAKAAAKNLAHILTELSRSRRPLSPAALRHRVEALVQAAAEAGSHVNARQATQIKLWKERAGFNKPATPTLAVQPPTPASKERRPKGRQPLHKQVARRHWIKRNCPRCRASKGADCVIDDGTGTGEVRAVPHDERLQPIVEERKIKARQAPRPWRVYEVACPDCGRAPGARCASPSGGVHRSRVDLARENTRKGLPRP
ncbi:hypothetical protein AB0P37_11635 [Streptomyces antimycoticus]|uniref:zinc finger domain-containing protein n=1 Tax=Streptomyces antimycoticus TaxID=68175 RepID=UPI00343E33F8